MLKTISMAGLILAALVGWAGRAQAQAISWDNVHINVTEPAKAADWYVKNLGATPVGVPGQGTQVMFGKILLVFLKGQEPQTSAGSLIDHIGLSFTDVDAALSQAQAGGAKVLTPVREIPNLFKLGFIEDPFGIKIEMVQDSELVGFHHVHLLVPNPETTLGWYQNMFGGERAKLKGRIDGLRYGGVWLLAQNNGGKMTNPHGSIQYIGLLVGDIHQMGTALQGKGVKFSVEPRSLRTLWYAIAEDCDGSRVEMIQRSQI